MKTIGVFLISLILFIFTIACGKKGSESVNYAPVIQSVTADPDTVAASTNSRVSCSATDQNNDILVYSWFSEFGDFPVSQSGSIALWHAPEDTGTFSVTAVVSDGSLADSESVDIVVVTQANRPPEIQSVTANPQIIIPDATTDLTCIADDPDGDSLIYAWSSEQGSFPNGDSGPVVQWQAPGSFGDYYIHVSVSDGQFAVSDSVVVIVTEPPGAN